MTQFLGSVFVISAVILLWRVTIKEKLVAKFIDRLPYLVRKPLTCGVCSTFWLSFIAQFIFVKVPSEYIPFFAAFPENSVATFFASWMITGMASVFVYYLFATFYEGSHYLAHKAEKMHEENAE